MTAAGRFKNIVLEHAGDIGHYVDAIPLEGKVPMEQARSYLQGMTSIPRVGLGAATRLLCMKRPDLFLATNRGSEPKICEIFGHYPVTVDQYLELIGDGIWSMPWFDIPEPDDATEKRIWRSRVALLDAVFYDHPDFTAS